MFVNVDSDEGVGEDAAGEDAWPRCAFGPSRPSDSATGFVPNVLDMLHDTIVHKNIVEDAALDLDEACSSICPLKTFLLEEDLTHILVEAMFLKFGLCFGRGSEASDQEHYLSGTHIL